MRNIDFFFVPEIGYCCCLLPELLSMYNLCNRAYLN
uniref:Uncharacterized protein n=1 Tax=Setaria viridis TaxID=4556 RepID=A0A4U6VU58_SETVI|nr:hypothetical protein SEVIR_3G305403v2 [Setaria viridis]